MEHCIIGSCPQVDQGAPCLKEGCPQWDNGEPEIEEELTLIEKLRYRDLKGYSSKDVDSLIYEVGEMVGEAMDLIDAEEYGKAWAKLLNVRVQIGEE